jgi:hypothetical protein
MLLQRKKNSRVSRKKQEGKNKMRLFCPADLLSRHFFFLFSREVIEIVFIQWGNAHRLAVNVTAATVAQPVRHGRICISNKNIR